MTYDIQVSIFIKMTLNKNTYVHNNLLLNENSNNSGFYGRTKPS